MNKKQTTEWYCPGVYITKQERIDDLTRRLEKTKEEIVRANRGLSRLKLEEAELALILSNVEEGRCL